MMGARTLLPLFLIASVYLRSSSALDLPHGPFVQHWPQDAQDLHARAVMLLRQGFPDEFGQDAKLKPQSYLNIHMARIVHTLHRMQQVVQQGSTFLLIGEKGFNPHLISQIFKPSSMVSTSTESAGEPAGLRTHTGKHRAALGAGRRGGWGEGAAACAGDSAGSMQLHAPTT